MVYFNFKNTYFFWVFISVFGFISCSDKSTTKTNAKNVKISQNLTHDSLSYTVIDKDLKISYPVDYMNLIKDKVVAVVGNQTSVVKNKNNGFTHLIDTLISLKITVKKVFSPEHGFRGKADAGEKVADGKDLKTGLPILSLHGKNKKPTPSQLQGLDVLIFDIQDVGVRFYTYISTLHYIMEACAEENIQLIVIDRPNPNAHYIDGPMMEREHQGFLGMHSVPLVYGMTIGEYATMINGEKWLKNGIQCNLKVMSLKNYTHQTSYSLPIKPSPNLPNDKSVNLYPSLGLFEGTSINAGRGTEMQFQIFGAPYLDKEVYLFSYTPQEKVGAKHPKQKGKSCNGKDLRGHEKLNVINLLWLINAYNNTPKEVEFFQATFTAHAGTKKLQQQIKKGMSADKIRATWQADIESFKKIRTKYLIYH